MKKLSLALAAGLIAAGLAYWFLQPNLVPENRNETQVPAAGEEATRVEIETASATATDSATTHSEISSPASPAKAAPADFAKNLEVTQAKLPTVTQIQALSLEEKHHAPAAIIQAGADIGDVAAAIEKDPSLAPQGMEFYAKCTKRSDLAHSVRAVCLSSLRELGQQSHAKWDEAGIPANVVRIVNEMKDKK